MITRRDVLSAVALLSVLPGRSELFGQETAGTAPDPSVQESLTEHKECTFTGETVPLDNSSFEGCSFQGCTLTYAGGPSRLVRNKFIDCSFELAGGAANGLFLLRTLGLVTTYSKKVRATPSRIAVEQSLAQT